MQYVGRRLEAEAPRALNKKRPLKNREQQQDFQVFVGHTVLGSQMASYSATQGKGRATAHYQLGIAVFSSQFDCRDFGRCLSRDRRNKFRHTVVVVSQLLV